MMTETARAPSIRFTVAHGEAEAPPVTARKITREQVRRGPLMTLSMIRVGYRPHQWRAD